MRTGMAASRSERRASSRIGHQSYKKISRGRHMETQPPIVKRSRTISRNGEGSMALNNCFNSPTCTSMTEHLGGSGSPAEGLSWVPEGLVIGLEYAMRQDSCEVFPDDRSNAGSQELDRP